MKGVLEKWWRALINLVGRGELGHAQLYSRLALNGDQATVCSEDHNRVRCMQGKCQFPVWSLWLQRQLNKFDIHNVCLLGGVWVQSWMSALYVWGCLVPGTFPHYPPPSHLNQVQGHRIPQGHPQHWIDDVSATKELKEEIRIKDWVWCPVIRFKRITCY